jgi:hypothetical protein
LAFFRRTIVAIAILAVSGCTAAQVESSRMQKVVAETKTSGQACTQTISNNPQYAPLASKTALGTDQYSLEMLTNKSIPSKSEIALIYKLYGDIQGCRRIILDGLSKVHPLAVAPAIESFNESDKLWAELASGKLTWGKFNEDRKTGATQLTLKLNQAGQQIDAQLQNQHQLEIEQRQQAAAAIQQWSYQQQALANQRAAINAANRPIMTNCNYTGTTANCTSN